MDDYLDGFEGVMIDVSGEPFGLPHSVPGWKCKACGWTVGCSGEPPPHECPTDGIQQQCQHVWGEMMPLPLAHHVAQQDIVYRECQLCGKLQHRYAEANWF